MEIEALLRSFGDSARVGELLAAGATERQLRRAVDSGSVERPRHGILALPDARTDFLAARLAGGLLTCVSAAEHHGLWVLKPAGMLHLASERGCRGEVVNHRRVTVPPRFRRPVAGLADVVIHALRCLPEDDALVITESALKSGNVARGFLELRLAGSRNAKVRGLLARATRVPDSAPEVVLREILRSAGLNFVEHARIDGIGEVDFLVEGWLIVEFDGAAFHMDRRSFRRDLSRNNAGVMRSYATLRFVYEDVMGAPGAVMETIAKALQRRPRGLVPAEAGDARKPSRVVGVVP